MAYKVRSFINHPTEDKEGPRTCCTWPISRFLKDISLTRFGHCSSYRTSRDRMARNQVATTKRRMVAEKYSPKWSRREFKARVFVTSLVKERVLNKALVTRNSKKGKESLQQESFTPSTPIDNVDCASASTNHSPCSTIRAISRSDVSQIFPFIFDSSVCFILILWISQWSLFAGHYVQKKNFVCRFSLCPWDKQGKSFASTPKQEFQIVKQSLTLYCSSKESIGMSVVDLHYLYE